MSLPEGYQKAPKAKRDEHNPRPRLQGGRPKVCQCCYRSGRSIVDHVCQRCLSDRRELALLEREIAAVHPATASMTSVQIFRRLWEQNKKMTARIKELKR